MKTQPNKILVSSCAAAALAFGSHAASAATLTNHFTFDSDFNDSVGSITGTAAGDSTGDVMISTTESIRGGGSLFVPADLSYVSLNSTISPSSSDSYSIAFWVKSSSTYIGGNKRASFMGKVSDFNNGIYATSDGTELNFRGNGNQSDRKFTTNTSPNVLDEQWHHIAMTYNEAADGTANGLGQITFYVDGTLVNASGTSAVRGGFRINSLGYGNVTNNTSHTDRDFEGFLDDVRYYDGVLTESEVAALAVPEPSATALLGLGALGFLLRRRR